MNKILIWDIPTRLFHWCFAAAITGSLGIALFTEEHDSIFQFHMVLGVAAVFLLAMRVILGLVGSRYSRFANIPLRPEEIARYFAGVFSGKAKAYTGQNPGSALAALLMFILVVLLFVTGIGLGGEAGKEIHGPLAYALLAVILVHLAGLALHAIRRKENVAAPMITGRVTGRPEESIPSARPVWGVIFFTVGALWVGGLVRNYDPANHTMRLPFPGVLLHLAHPEEPNEDGGGHHKEGRNHEAGAQHEERRHQETGKHHDGD